MVKPMTPFGSMGSSSSSVIALISKLDLAIPLLILLIANSVKAEIIV